MTIPAGAVKIVLSGQLGGGEVWQSGFWVQGPTLTNTEVASCASALYTVFNQGSGTHLMAALKGQWSNSTTWTTVTVYNYHDTSGEASTVGTFTGTGQVGSQLSGMLPDQISLVVTLRTALAGAHHRGRMFLPYTGAVIDSNGLVNGTAVGNVLAGLKADLASVVAEAHLAGFPVVVLSKTLGSVQPVTTLTADLRPDIQRRRANRQGRGALQVVAL
jgi:hypothetical protein